MNNNTKAFLEAVMNPIMAEQAALVPDLECADSLCLTDYVELSRPVNNTVGAVRGILIWLRVHESYIYTNDVSGTPKYIYSLCYGFTDANGDFLADSTTGKLYDIAPANVETIQGGTTINVDQALISGFRMFAMGLRVLPTVEFVTDTSVNYMVRVIGGQLSMEELVAGLNNNTNIETLIRNSTCAETFANNEGCCARYNPFQNEQQLRVQALSDSMNSAQSFEYHKMPAIFIQFSNSTAIGSTAPCIIHARFWLHGILKKPSPIYAQQSRADINYPAMRTILSGCHPTFPYVTKGHSFPPLIAIGGMAVKILANAGLNYLSSQRRIGYQPNRRPRQRRQNRNNNNSNRNNNNRGRNRGRGQNRKRNRRPGQIGQRRIPMMPQNPRNIPIVRRQR